MWFKWIIGLTNLWIKKLLCSVFKTKFRILNYPLELYYSACWLSVKSVVKMSTFKNYTKLIFKHLTIFHKYNISNFISFFLNILWKIGSDQHVVMLSLEGTPVRESSHPGSFWLPVWSHYFHSIPFRSQLHQTRNQFFNHNYTLRIYFCISTHVRFFNVI